MSGYERAEKGAAQKSASSGNSAQHRINDSFSVLEPVSQGPGGTADALNRSARVQSLMQLRHALDQSPRVQELRSLQRILNPPAYSAHDAQTIVQQKARDILQRKQGAVLRPVTGANGTRPQMANEVSVDGAGIVQRVIIIEGTKRIDVGELRRSGEADVYEAGNSFYKVYTNEPKRLIEQMMEAEKAGVTVVKYRPYRAQRDENGAIDNVFVLQTEKLFGRQFFASKPGGLTVFKNEVNGIYDLGDLGLMQRVLKAAIAVKLSDPQGFVTNSNKLVFFDIHTQGSSSAVEDMYEVVTARILQVKELQITNNQILNLPIANNNNQIVNANTIVHNIGQINNNNAALEQIAANNVAAGTGQQGSEVEEKKLGGL